jgi:cystatin-A/B
MNLLTLTIQVRQAAEKEANRAFAQYEVVSYCTQLVAGLNYFIKVKVGDGENDYIHIRVYQTLSQETSLSGIQLDISRDAPIEYF